MDTADKERNALDASSKTDSPELTDYSVGHCKPPMIRRFKSGQSGNKKGRPRGSKNRKTIVKEIANEMHTVTEDGRQRRRSTLELMLLALRNRAAECKGRALREYIKYLAKFEPQDTRSNGGYLVVRGPITPEEAIAEGEKANEEARARRAAKIQSKS